MDAQTFILYSILNCVKGPHDLDNISVLPSCFCFKIIYIHIFIYFLKRSFFPPWGTGQCDSCLTSFVWLLLLRLLLLQDLTFLHSKDEGEARSAIPHCFGPW